jgi:predicted outer membrane repeat protein/VCBS repeat-containing protein
MFDFAFNHYLRALPSRLRGPRSVGRPARRRPSRPLAVERLEDRTVPSTFTVNTTVDSVDANPGDGIAADSLGRTSLRAAIMEANALAGADTIILPAATYLLALAGPEENAGRTGDLDITGDLTVVGAGAASTTIDGNLNDRVFDVRGAVGSTRFVSLQNLTITGGKTVQTADPLGDYGGGLRIDFFTDVTISGSVFRNNSAPRTGANLMFGLGGAISNDGKLTILDCRFDNNSASNSGGAIYGGGLGAVTTIRNTTFTDNTASSGGAIQNHRLMTIENSTFSANRGGTVGSGQGGAIDNNDGGDLTLTNCTLSGNAATFGGAISNFQTLKVFSSTIAGNTGSNGGGISVSTPGTVTFENTIIATNTASSMGLDVSGAVLSQGHNLVGNTADSTGFSAGLGDLQNVNPLLGALANNGGPTQTQALLAGSPAIDAANTVTSPATDQRGVARPQGPAADIGAFELQVTANRPPVAADQSVMTSEDTAVSGTVTANDPDGNPLTFALVIGPAHGTMQLNASTGGFTYTPALNYNGPDSFTYKANDGRLDSNVATVTITVSSVNDAPVASNDSYTVDEGQVLIVRGSAGTLLSLNSQPGDLIGGGKTQTFTPSTGSFRGRRNFDNGVSIDYRGFADPTSFWFLDFAAPGDVPLIPGYYANAARFPFEAPDQPGMDVSGEGRGSNTLTGKFTVTEARYGATGEVVGLGASFEQHSEGEAPALFGEIRYNAGPTTDGILLNDTDVDGEPLHPFLVSGPSHGTLTLSPSGAFFYTPDPSFTGTDSFTYKANDGQLDSNVATVTITVMPVNVAPVANNDVYSTSEDTPLAVPAPGLLGNDTDADGDPLSAVLVSGPAHGTVAMSSNGAFTYSPAANFNGTDSFTYKANDGTADSNVATVTITVRPVNDAPVANDDSYSTAEDNPLTVSVPGVLANDTDTDGDALTAVLVSGPIHGTLALSGDGSFTYTPAANFNGTDSFTYKANDGQLDSYVATVTITVSPVNDAPAPNNDSYSTSDDTPLIVNAPGVLANDTDVDGDTLSALLVSGPAHGTLTLNGNGSFSYAPAAGFSGSDKFTYRASDGSLGTLATVAISVTPKPPTPGKVTGSGSLDGGVRQFNISVQSREGAGGLSFTGQLSFDDSQLGIHLTSTSITYLRLEEDGVHAKVRGAATVNGVSGYTFTVYVEDHGEPGRNDKLRIVVTGPGGFAYDSLDFALLGGLLDSGNVRVKKK